MENWLKISLILSMFGFLKEIRPSEPFVFEYLSGKWTNLTVQEVNADIFAVGTYANTPLVLVAFLVTDLLRYKPLIILCGIFGIIVWSLLIWLPVLRIMQFMEIFYAAFASCDIAYFTYMYAKVDKLQYPKVTSNARIGYLLGRLFSGVIGQVLTSLEIMNYKELNYITLGAMILATFTSFFLPSVENTIYFHRDENNKHAVKTKWEAFRLMGKFAKDSYSKVTVVKWSVVNIVSACGFGLVEVYIQSLWSEINKDDQIVLGNGIVVTIYTLIGIIGAYFAGYFKIDWSEKSIILFIVYFASSGTLLIISSQTKSIYLCYAAYSIFGGIYQFLTTVVYSEISQRILSDSYGLIFGLNTFFALIIQSITVFIVVKTLETPIRNQYLIFGLWHIIFLILFVIFETFSKVLNKKRKSFDVVII